MSLNSKSRLNQNPKIAFIDRLWSEAQVIDLKQNNHCGIMLAYLVILYMNQVSTMAADKYLRSCGGGGGIEKSYL